MTPIRWGMIGCGDVTERKSAPAYQQVEGFALHGVFSRTRAKAANYAARHGVPRVFDSAEALIHAPDIDAVYIATPPDSHESHALEVARAGKPCCIEKPMAPASSARFNSPFMALRSSSFASSSKARSPMAQVRRAEWPI